MSDNIIEFDAISFERNNDNHTAKITIPQSNAWDLSPSIVFLNMGGGHIWIANTSCALCFFDDRTNKMYGFKWGNYKFRFGYNYTVNKYKKRDDKSEN